MRNDRPRIAAGSYVCKRSSAHALRAWAILNEQYWATGNLSPLSSLSTGLEGKFPLCEPRVEAHHPVVARRRTEAEKPKKDRWLHWSASLGARKRRQGDEARQETRNDVRACEQTGQPAGPQTRHEPDADPGGTLLRRRPGFRARPSATDYPAAVPQHWQGRGGASRSETAKRGDTVGAGGDTGPHLRPGAPRTASRPGSGRRCCRRPC